MEVLFHFVFELIKITILSCIYTAFLLLSFKFIGRLWPNSWFDQVSKKEFRFWFQYGILISVGLFAFMFTYFGDHGLGDEAIVPLGNYKIAKQINGQNTYIQDSKGNQFGINKFALDENKLYAETQREFNGEAGDYLVWDLRTDHLIFYKTKNDYLAAAKHGVYPNLNSFKDFDEYYKNHWNGWRFWFLP